MKRIITGIIMLCWIVGYAPTLNAEEKKLSPQAQELQRSLALLKEKPKDKSIQIQYLQKFPKDITTFERFFNPSDFSELYDGADYIFALHDLANDHPVLVGKILVGLSKNAHYEADALSYLQSVTAGYASTYTTAFVRQLKGHSKKEVTNLINYLADVENFTAYSEYPLIIENLRKLGETKLAQQFVDAKNERMKKPAHRDFKDEPASRPGV